MSTRPEPGHSIATTPAEALELHIAGVENDLNDELSQMGMIRDHQLHSFVTARLSSGWNWIDVSHVGDSHKTIAVTSIDR